VSWTQVNRGLAATPIRAFPDDFRQASMYFFDVERNIRTVVQQFQGLADGDISRFEGRAASAFVRALQDVAKDMQDLPGVANQIAGIFGDHARVLTDLRAEVDRALAAALTTKGQRDAAKRGTEAADNTLRSVKTQLDSLRNAGAQPDDPQLTYLHSRVTTASNEVGRKQATLRIADADLQRVVGQYKAFEDREGALNTATAAHLGKVNLKSPVDPSNLEKLAHWAEQGLGELGAFAKELISDLFALTSAFIDARFFGGDWGEVLWRLNDVLHAVSTALGVVAVALTAAAVVLVGVGLAASVIFPPAGVAILGVAALAWRAAGVLGDVSTVVTYAAAGTTALLFATKSKNSETGKAMGADTLVDDGRSAVLTLGFARLNTGFDSRMGPNQVVHHWRTNPLNYHISGEDGRFVTMAVKDSVMSDVQQHFWVAGLEHGSNAIQAPGTFQGLTETPPDHPMWRTPPRLTGELKALLGPAR
jgi:hypothetical protein